jgi:hypothetical protein
MPVAELRLPPEEIERRTTNADRNYSVARRNSWVGVGTLIISFITMGAVICYAIIAAHQRDAMRDQVTQMRRANDLTADAQRQTREVVVTENRPWLGVLQIDLVTFEVDKKPAVRVRVMNVGRAPAERVSTIVGVFLRQNPPNQNTQIESRRPPPTDRVVLPNMDIFLPGTPADVLSIEQSKAFKASALYVVVVGRILYTDRSGGARETRFCAHLIGGTQLFTLCDVGNSAT